MSEHQAVWVYLGSTGTPQAGVRGGGSGQVTPSSLSQTRHMFLPGHVSVRS